MRVIEQLIAGFDEFHREFHGPNAAEYAQLMDGQSPQTMIIGCSDSRLSPAILTKCAPGDLFTVRNVANLVPPYEKDGHRHGVSAALEFAVCHLEVAHVVVFGHSHCGGINALMAGSCGCPAGGCDCGNSNFIDRWMSIAAPAREKVLAELPDADEDTLLRAMEREAIKLSLANLVTFPFVAERTARGSLMLHGWYFDLQTADLLAYDKDVDEFHKLTRQTYGID